MTIAHVNTIDAPPVPTTALPFALNKKDDYLEWRQWKLSHYPNSYNELIVPIQEPDGLTLKEIASIQQRIKNANMAIYQLPEDAHLSKLQIQHLGQQFGLYQLDHNLCADEESISTLKASKGKNKRYIPYTNKGLSWHTDGYYNRLDQRIRAFIIHCVSPAAAGGENAVLDPEMVYIQLRDMDPAYIEALMDPLAMTIPANEENGKALRPDQTGPVFSVDPYTGQLHMRYTARTRNIIWKQDKILEAAVKALENVLATSSRVFQFRLKAGQGLICNNVLHNRSAFRDDTAGGQVRVMYRARYYDRVRVKAFKTN